jgi:hypothetical protein
MRKFVILLPVLCLSILANGQTSKHTVEAKTPAFLSEPFFDIAYNPSKVHYDPVPLAFVKVCKHTYQHEYVYAYLKSGDAEYFVISGYSSDQDGDSLGYVAMIRANHCDSADLTNTYVGIPPQNGYNDTKNEEGIPGKNAPSVRDPGEFGAMGNYHYILRSSHEEEILRGLLQDNFKRGVRAFGGEIQYKQIICTSKMMKDFSGYADMITEQELKSFCSQSPSILDAAEGKLKGK